MHDAQSHSPPDPLLADVIRLRPIRILVISRDHAYQERAVSVLAELGPVAFAVAPLDDRDVVVDLIGRQRADVVVLDATDHEAAAGDLISVLARCAPQTGIVAVCHHCTDAARRLQALPKWGWTQDLRAGVELAYHEGNPLRPAPGSLRRRSAWQRMAGPLLKR